MALTHIPSKLTEAMHVPVPPPEELLAFNTKVPPGWDGKCCTFRFYDKRLGRWLNITELPKEKQASAISLRLFGGPGKIGLSLIETALLEGDAVP